MYFKQLENARIEDPLFLTNLRNLGSSASLGSPHNKGNNFCSVEVAKRSGEGHHDGSEENRELLLMLQVRNHSSRTYAKAPFDSSKVDTLVGSADLANAYDPLLPVDVIWVRCSEL